MNNNLEDHINDFSKEVEGKMQDFLEKFLEVIKDENVNLLNKDK